jgi:PAS domain S-box-containing protein
MPHAQATMLQRVRAFLPEGHALPEAEWGYRHRFAVWAVLVHAVALTAFGAYRGWPTAFVVGEGALIAVLGLLALPRTLSRRFRSSMAALGLVTSSAVLVQFSARYGTGQGGFIEAHFHFFVVVAFVALYQDWVPFLLAILYVALDHGVVGTLKPEWVYNHVGGVENPWKWAVIHAVFVLSECVALVIVWRHSEQARARTELVLRSTGEGLVGLDLDGRITFANPAAQTLTGRPERDLLGLAAGDVFTGWTSPGHPGAATAETDLRRPDGTSIPVEVVATPILHAGRVEGAVLAFKDVSERRRAELEHKSRVERESEIRRLREEATFKTLFINTAAHELRTPLTPLKLQLHVLRGERRGELNEEQRRITGILWRNLDRLGHLVEDVLDVGRLQAGRIRLEPAPVRLDQVAAEVVEAFQELAQKGGVELACKASGDVELLADSQRINQILFNLVDNGVKFTPAGGRVDVLVSQEGDRARIQVRDNGIGLDAAQRARLFQPFGQAHDPMEQTRTGSGLGLYISRGLAELHGGSLDCHSDGPGKGTTFTLVLPIRTVASAQAEVSVSQAAPG